MASEAKKSEILALKAVAWLVAHDDLCLVFLRATGASEVDLRTRIEDPEFLSSVLDFLLMDDAWVIAFCDQHNLAYDQIMRARCQMPGGEQVHWT